MGSLSRNYGIDFIELRKREIGLCPPRNYYRGVSKALIKHIHLYGQLTDDDEERSPITLAFNSTGKILISGCADGQLNLWEWETGKLVRLIEVLDDGLSVSKKLSKQQDDGLDYSPRTAHNTIISLAYSSTSELLASYTNHTIYLFQKNMGFSPADSFFSSLEPSADQQVYSGQMNLNTLDIRKEVGFYGPSDEYILSGSDRGRIFIWEKKGCELIRSIVGDGTILHEVEAHPQIPVLATFGNINDVRILSPLYKKMVHVLAGPNKGESGDDELDDD